MFYMVFTNIDEETTIFIFDTIELKCFDKISTTYLIDNMILGGDKAHWTDSEYRKSSTEIGYVDFKTQKLTYLG